MARSTINNGSLRADTLVPPNACSVVFWAKDATNSNIAVALARADDSFRLDRTTTATWRWWQLYSGGLARWTWPQALTGIDNTVWHHLAFVRVGTADAPMLYVNGDAKPFVTEAGASGTIQAGSGAIYVLNDVDGVSSWDGSGVNGGIEGLAIYNRAISETEVDLIVTQGRYPLPGLVRFYPFNDNASPTRDVSSAQASLVDNDSRAGSAGPSVPVRFWYVTTPTATVNGTTIIINWSSVAGATGYVVELSANGGASWSTAATVSGTSASISNLQPTTAYQFRVSTSNGVVVSAPGSAISATTGVASGGEEPQDPELPDGDVNPIVLASVRDATQPISVLMRERYGGRIVRDLSYELTTCLIETDQHGFASIDLAAPMDTDDAESLAQNAMGQHIEVGGECVWEGRIEKPGIRSTNDGTEFQATAYGYQVAFEDIPLTNAYVASDPSHWRTIRLGEVNGVTPRFFEFELDTSLLIMPKQGEPSGHGGLMIVVPLERTLPWQTFQFDWAFLAPAGWVAEIWVSARDGSGRTRRWDRSGSGAPQGDSNDTISVSADRIEMTLRWTGAAVYNSGGTGSAYFQLFNPKVASVASLPLTADAMMRDMVATIAAANPSQLSPATQRIRNPGIELTDRWLEDADMRKVLDDLAGMGGSNAERWQWAVWERQVLRFGPVDSDISYVVRIGQYEIDRIIDELYTQVYLVYQNTQKERATTTRTNTGARLPFTRRLALESDANTDALRTQEQAAAAADAKTPRAKVGIEVDALESPSGARIPLGAAQAGRLASIPDLSPSLGGDLRRTTFEISRTRYDAIKNTLKLDLELPIAALDWLLARTKAGQ